jgi:sugar phosphate isomerase/epimerase
MTRREMASFCAGIVARGDGRFGLAAELKQQDSLRLGVASYSFREFQRKLAISMTKQLGVRYISVKEYHLPYTVTADEAAKAKSEFKKAGLEIMSGGNISLQDEDPKALRHLFEYARMCGMPMMVCAPPTRRSTQLRNLSRNSTLRPPFTTTDRKTSTFPLPNRSWKP